MGLDTHIGEKNILLTRLDKVVNDIRANSLWPLSFGLACCAIEMMATGASRYDLARFGSEVVRASPRQADLMIGAGPVGPKMGPARRAIFDQKSDPHWGVSMGAGASCGGLVYNYAPREGVEEVGPHAV